MSPTREHVTLLPPDPEPRSEPGLSSFLPPDLLEQVRRRVGLLALLLGIAFSFDIVLHGVAVLVAILGGPPVEPGNIPRPAFLITYVLAALASFALSFVARSRNLTASTLLAAGLVYEVAVCFVIAISIFLTYYQDHGVLPPLTWVPMVVVLFPLILPGPPRLMLAAAVVAGATAPLSIAMLEATGTIQADLEPYMQATVASGFAVVFAWIGARTIYGLGREIAAAREMGSYHLEERLGQGGMGEVWRARHRFLARPAAVKLIRRSLLASPEVLRRFEREAQVIAGLRSPHTVDLYDFGVAEGGAFYYVMELLDGLDAERLINAFGPVPAERAIHILRQVCHSLSEAESLGLVHRDIKPANIFLCRYGEEYDFVKVLDFGIVKALEEPAERGPALTRENRVPGSPAFIAPEQAEGVPIDGRADIYATGCVAFWLLTGHTVFSAESPMGYLVQHARTPPPRPSSRSHAPIPAGLDNLVLACLAKDPSDRPQTARELARRLAEVDTGSAWTEDRARTWWAGHMADGLLRPTLDAPKAGSDAV